MNKEKLDNVYMKIDDYLVFNNVFPNDIHTTTLEETLMDIDNEKDIINQTKMTEYCNKVIDANNRYNNSQKTITKLYNLKYLINEYYEAINIYNTNKRTILITMQENRNYSDNRSEYDLLEYIASKNSVIQKQNKVLEAINNIPDMKKEYYG
jgi:hypothetical protein